MSASCSACASAGWDALGWPVFEIGPAPDPEHARRTLGRLADFDLAIFVSPAAVRAAAALLDGAWPGTTAIGAVGAATGVAVSENLKPPAGTFVIAPASDGAAGSEAFWAEWEQCGRTARRVLILRAQHGREWLAERFGAAGAVVEDLAVYTRTDPSIDPAARSEVQRAMASSVPAITVFSSSEAVDALDRQMADIDGARENGCGRAWRSPRTSAYAIGCWVRATRASNCRLPTTTRWSQG